MTFRLLCIVATALALLASCGGGTALDLDGERIAFSNDGDGDHEIFVMNADGSGVTRLTENDVDDTGPTWSPGGERIAYAKSGSVGTTHGIVIMTAAGEFIERLTDSHVPDSFPVWSPDGSRIIFHRRNGGRNNDELLVINTDRSGISGLIDIDDARTVSGAWSSDGSSVSFSSNRDGEDLEIYKMKADGTEVVQLTDNDSADVGGVWSPDGSRLAFASERTGSWAIHIMNSDGSTVEQLTSGEGEARAPSWSPDGTRLAFQGNREGNWDIFVVNADGTNLTQITNDEADDVLPAWAPVA